MSHRKRAAPSIALAMIVKNEAAVIGRCLASVRPLVTHWVIVDTGSSDETASIVEAELADLPGALHHRPWLHFGHNRSELMALARGTADYLLLVDADMTVRQAGPLPELTADSYLLRHAGSLDYAVPRLVRGDLPWRFEGSTHEYLTCDEPYRDQVLDELVIEHHADGGARGDKFERDRALLEADLARDPDDARTTFYLAQTLADLGDAAGAIECYRRRVVLGGWEEEVFCAQLRVGELLANEAWEAAVPELLKAWQIRPARAEPLYHLARGYRSRGQHHLARHFALAGLAIPYPDDRLFVQRDCYDWGLLFEFAIAAYWTGDAQASVEANETLLRRGVPDHVEEWVRHNLAWGLVAVGRGDEVPMSPLPVVGQLAPDAVGGKLLGDLVADLTVDVLDLDLGSAQVVSIGADGASEPWSAFNPCIASDPATGGFRLLLRSSNYRFGPSRAYVTIGEGQQIRTVNHLVGLDADLGVRWVQTLPEVPGGAPVFDSAVVGCEDMRVVEVAGAWWAFATVRDRTASSVCEMALLPLGRGDELPAVTDGEAEPLAGATLTVLRTPNPRTPRHEKNWMPFADDDRLLVLYACSPVIVFEVDPATGEMSERSRTDSPAACAPLRGGSPGVRVDGGWLFVAHEVSLAEGGERSYLHRVLRLVRRDGDRFEIDAVTPRFSFTGAPVEFCAGLAVRDGEALLSFGVMDATPNVARLPLAELVSLLEPLAS